MLVGLMKPWHECPQIHSLRAFRVTVDNTTTSATTVFYCDCYVMSVGLMNPLRCSPPPVVGLSRHQNLHASFGVLSDELFYFLQDG